MLEDDIACRPRIDALQQTKPGFEGQWYRIFPSDNCPLGDEPDKAVEALRPA